LKKSCLPFAHHHAALSGYERFIRGRKTAPKITHRVHHTPQKIMVEDREVAEGLAQVMVMASAQLPSPHVLLDLS